MSPLEQERMADEMLRMGFIDAATYARCMGIPVPFRWRARRWLGERALRLAEWIYPGVGG